MVDNEKLKKIDWSFIIQMLRSNFDIQGQQIFKTTAEQLMEIQKEITNS